MCFIKLTAKFLHASLCYLIVMRCAIWYNLYNLKKVKNTHGGVLLLVKLQAKPATLLKVTLFIGVFHVFYLYIIH